MIHEMNIREVNNRLKIRIHINRRYRISTLESSYQSEVSDVFESTCMGMNGMNVMDGTNKMSEMSEMNGVNKLNKMNKMNKLDKTNKLIHSVGCIVLCIVTRLANVISCLFQLSTPDPLDPPDPIIG